MLPVKYDTSSVLGFENSSMSIFNNNYSSCEVDVIFLKWILTINIQCTFLQTIVYIYQRLILVAGSILYLFQRIISVASSNGLFLPIVSWWFTERAFWTVFDRNFSQLGLTEATQSDKLQYFKAFQPWMVKKSAKSLLVSIIKNVLNIFQKIDFWQYRFSEIDCQCLKKISCKTMNILQQINIPIPPIACRLHFLWISGM